MDCAQPQIRQDNQLSLDLMVEDGQLVTQTLKLKLLCDVRIYEGTRGPSVQQKSEVVQASD